MLKNKRFSLKFPQMDLFIQKAILANRKQKVYYEPKIHAMMESFSYLKGKKMLSAGNQRVS